MRNSWTCCRIFLILAFLFFSGAVSAQEKNPGFIELRVNTRAEIPVFQTYLTEEEVPFLNFNALMRALEIPVAYDPSLGRAAGFLADGRTRFILDTKRNTVVVGERALVLEKSAFHLINQELYVRYSEFPSWMPVKAVWDLEAYRVIFATQYPLPSEEKERRSLKRKTLAAQKGQTFTKQELERKIPWFDPGMFEFRVSASGGHGHPDGALATLRGVHRFLKGDLDYSLTQAHFNNGSKNGRVDYARLTYYDPLHTWQAQFGNTFTTFSPLVMNAVSFEGGSFFTGGRQLRFGRTALIGTAPPGSEVDLYRLGVLVGFTQADEKGFYRFENVPLTIDKTNLEARIFTPDGRQLSTFHDVISQEEMLARGKLASVGGGGQGQTGGETFQVGGGEVRYGLTDWLTMGAYVLTLSNFHLAYDQIADQTTGGAFVLVRPLNWLLLLTERAAGLDEDGQAIRLDVRFGFRTVSLEIDQRTFDGVYAPPNRTRSEAFSQNDLADQILIIQGRARVFSTNLNLKNVRTDFGETRNSLENSLQADRRLFKKFTLSTTFRNERHTEQNLIDSGVDSQEALGIYQLSLLSRVEVFLRNNAVLNGSNSTQMRLTVTKNHRLGSPWAYRVSHINFSDQKNLSQASVGYLFAKNFRISAEADSENKWLAKVEYSLPFRIAKGKLERHPPETFGRAGLTGRVFIDNNGNGTYDPGEPPVADVKVLAPGIGNLVSDQSGRVRGWGLPTHEPSRISMDQHTTDAMFAPLHKSQPIAPRPGEEVVMEFPLVSFGGVEGVLSTGSPGGTPSNGLVVLLLNLDGTEKARTRAEFDGGFLLENIPPGTYLLRPDPRGLKERGLRAVPRERTLVFPGGRDPKWFEGADFKLEKMSPQ